MMMEQRQNSSIYTANLTDLLAASAYKSAETDERIYNTDTFTDNGDRCSDSPSSIIEEDSSQSAFGVDLSGKGTSLGGKSFTIAAILGLTNSEDDVMNLSVQERLQNQRQLQNYLYSGHDIQRFNDSLCRSVVAVPNALRESPRPGDVRTQGQLKSNRTPHSITCSSSSGRSKRIRTIFTPEQLERLEAEFERQQYMVGPERLYLAHALQLTEAQVKVWFQNRRIKWRKHHLEVTQQRLAVLQRHRPDDREEDI